MSQLPLPLPYASVRIQYSGAPGSLIAQVSSVDERQDLVVDAKTMNEGDGWSGSGANPWHVDDNTRSILFLTDESDQPAHIGFSVTVSGVHYYLSSLELAPHETRAIDLRQLRDAQVADFKGNRISAGATDGSVNWIRLDNVPVMGRVAVITKSSGTASSYDCCVCICPASYNHLSVSPVVLTMVPTDTGQLLATAWYYDCNYQAYTYDRTTYSSWSSAATAVATVDNGSYKGLTTAVAGGSATLTGGMSGAVYSVQGSYGSQYCVVAYYTYQSGNSTGDVVQITGSNEVWWFNGQTPSGYTTTLTLTALPAGGTSYGWSIVAGTDKAVIGGYPSANQVNIVGNDLSTSQGDVTVQCRVTASGATGTASRDLTVRGPYQLVPGAVNHLADPTYAYQSVLNYSVEDNMGQLLPSAVYINEYWTTSVVPDYAGTNWRRGSAGGFSMPDSTFADHIQGEVSTMTPTPSPPQSPQLSSTKVDHWGQDWYVGSATSGLGARVQTDTLQKYVDHALHFPITSPAP